MIGQGVTFNFVIMLLFSNLAFISSSKVATLDDVEGYLVRFGYLQTNYTDKYIESRITLKGHKSNQSTFKNNKISHQTANAVKNFQSFFGLPQTGILDPLTLESMNRPRCGNSEEKFANQIFVVSNRKKRYAHGNFTWTKRDITYRVSQFPKDYTDASEIIEQELAIAFSLWADVVELNFTKTNSKNADIEILFASGEHGDGKSFDGPGFMLGHAFEPNPDDPLAGDIHFDNAEPWVVGKSEDQAIHFRWAAIHEIGHSLGLSHSMVKNSYMFPMYDFKYDPETPLHADDIIGIEALYAESWYQHSTTQTKSPEITKTRVHLPEAEAEQLKPPLNPTRLKIFAEHLSEILYAINPTHKKSSESDEGNLLVCKPMKNSQQINRLCVPEKYF